MNKKKCDLRSSLGSGIYLSCARCLGDTLILTLGLNFRLYDVIIKPVIQLNNLITLSVSPSLHLLPFAHISTCKTN